MFLKEQQCIAPLIYSIRTSIIFELLNHFENLSFTEIYTLDYINIMLLCYQIKVDCCNKAYI